MTNVILGILGILLAATSALITMDYGGDYFIDSQNLANAAILQHAGQHVQTAYDLHDRRFGVAPSTLTALVSVPGYRAFLSSLPVLNGNGTYNNGWTSISANGAARNVLTVSAVSKQVCSATNKRVNNFANPEIIPSAPAFREGCYNPIGGQPVANNLYYRFMTY